MDNDGGQDTGLQIFAVAYWSNTWDDPFLQTRDGTGWSTAYASSVTDPERDNEITGGTLVIWSPDGEQAFPPISETMGCSSPKTIPPRPSPPATAWWTSTSVPSGFTRRQPVLTLNEGVTAVNDYSAEGYADAFNALFDKASKEYPFTQLKDLDWNAIYERHVGEFEDVRSDEDFTAPCAPSPRDPRRARGHGSEPAGLLRDLRRRPRRCSPS